MSLLLALALACPLLAPDAPAAQGEAGPVAELASPDPDRARRAAEALRDLGERGHELLWEGFAEAPTPVRLARTRWLLEDGGAASLESAIAALEDADAGVRANLARYLGRLRAPGPGARATVAGALAAAGRVETLAAPRAAIAEGLLALGGPEAAAALAELLAAWPRPERDLLAARLGELHGAGSRIAELVHGAFPSPGSGRGTPPDVLAALLPAYARYLADREAPETPRDRAPLALGLRHPSPEVRAAARAAVEGAVDRLRVLDRPRRAEALLAALAREGPRPEVGQYGRALQALQEGLDPALALEAARELERLSQTGVDRSSRLWRYRSAYLAGMARLAAGDTEACVLELDRAEGLLDALLAERAGLSARGGIDEDIELLHQRALLGLARAVQRLAAGAAPGDARVLELLRGTHELELSAQLFALEHDRAQPSSLDLLFEVEASPYRLVFARKPHAAWPVERSLELQLALGRALATVAPLELIGFEPIADALPGRADPLVDPPRRALLLAILREEAGLAWREYLEESDSITRRMREGGAVGADDEQRLMILHQTWRLREDAADRGDLAESHDELRIPSWIALGLARDLREEGRTRECRELCRRMLEALEGRELEQRFAFGLQLAAEVQITIGSSWTADDEPVRAEEELLEAVARLEELEDFYLERGAPAMSRVASATRANALVSLAVNANVKLVDEEKALEYFERAYELRQDDFMKVLLACYRARSGHEAEAREILVQVPLAPRFYYNLACTHALLGDRERALDLLERELAENHPSPGSLEEQKEWARSDPDLVSLRDDPRFARLVGTDETGGN